MNPVEDAIAIWKAGVAAVDARQLILNAVQNEDIPALNAAKTAMTIRVIGGGKAVEKMAAGLEEAHAEQLENMIGIVNVPDGATRTCRRIAMHPARLLASNFPTLAGVDGVERMLALVAGAHPEDIVIVLLSGGGSALLPSPVLGVSLDDKLVVTRLLHGCGATIAELNCVRKHLSRFKGGRLAEILQCPAVSLIISDVIGDPLDVIASGPTVPDPTTFSMALEILNRYQLRSRTPASVLDHLEKGANGDVPETPKRKLINVTNAIIGSNQIARYTAMLVARIHNWPTPNDIKEVIGEAKIAAKRVAAIIAGSSRPAAHIFGGETTVTLGPNPGKGGRNQEFVLAMLCELGEAGMKGVTILCAGTDGEDGPTDTAGAIGTLETLQRAKSLGLNPRDFLDRHDSYHFFEATGGLFKSGLTGTNVMDLGVILLT